MFRWYLDWLGSTRPTAAGPWCTWGLNKVLVYTSHARPASRLQHTAQRGALRRCVCFHVFTFRLYVSSLFYILSLIVSSFLSRKSLTHPPTNGNRVLSGSSDVWIAFLELILVFSFIQPDDIIILGDADLFVVMFSFWKVLSQFLSYLSHLHVIIFCISCFDFFPQYQIGSDVLSMLQTPSQVWIGE